MLLGVGRFNRMDRTFDPFQRFNCHYGRTTRHPGYAVSMTKRKRIEEPFGWMKTVGGLRKTRHCGRELVEWFFVLTAAACNLVRIPKILAATG
jgi:Transposase DDE domain